MDRNRESSPSTELNEEDLRQVNGGRRPPPEPEMLPVDWQRPADLPPPPPSGPDTPFQNIDWDKALRDGATPRAPARPRRPLMEV